MVVVLTGTNQLTMQTRLHEIINDFGKEHAGSIERFDGAELENTDSVLDAVRSISFLDPKKLVIIRNPSESKELLQRLQTIVSQTAESTDLVIIGALDRRSSVYKYLQKSAELTVFEDLSLSELSRWISAYISDRGGSITVHATTYLLEQIGPNQYRLNNELDKLLLVGQTITKEFIDELVEPVPQSKIFNLLDALFQGNAEKAWYLYEDQRLQGEEPYKIMSMITWQLQQLTYAVFSPNKTKDELVKAGVSPYTAQKSLQLARKISPKKLRYFITRLAETDYLSKTNAAVDSALAVYITEIATV